MKVLAFFVGLLVLWLTVSAGVLVIVDHTLSASYVESVAQRTNAYQQLATVLPGVLAAQASDANPQQQAEILQGMKVALTSDFLKRFLANALGQIESVLKGNATQVTIPLHDIGLRAQAAGVDVRSEQLKDITLPADKAQPVARVAHKVETTKLATLICAAVVLVAGLVLSWWRRSYRAVGWALVEAGVLTGAVWVALVILPDKLATKLALTGAWAPISPLLQAALKQVASDLRLEFGLLAAGLMVPGVALVALSSRLPGRQVAETVESPKVAPKPTKPSIAS